ncbi:murein hydrolase activator EnvC family protein [Sphingobacterium multivorum]|jgi:septal ring factor EnvC (AmiA/AmiB activator)|uniref:murein hydrolase activator EnvC family protein n=1 Tax=Sphingobacterium multivorum TaxID=28454 RepID=UPI000E034726|nr:peptidoglycan DD-metalloendopeptidase family protein [Sphingobacterium multivorum]HAU55665.1 peptidase M23 [Sphingobacterium sp.]MDF2853842.1 peptidase [Sphingobacterium multivorum]QQT47507.1 peptidoglycan DD-metalloendopeptidase family protein [Sphingobacterium multivorum]SUJ02761.1 Septal ring factor [Sphingobacterium multivorum]HCX57841.1 peptidase M23 [Sphingobacterium sp.]
MNFKKTILGIAAFLFMIGISSAQTRAELEKQREKLNREIAELQNTVKEIAKEKSLTQQQVRALSKQINLREQKINTITSEVAVINKHINANTAAVNKLKAELEKMKRDYEKMVMFAFRNRNAYNKLMFIFASKDFNQGFRRVKYLQQFNDSRKLKAADIENTKKQIEQKIAQLQADRNKQVALMKEQENEKKTISQQRSVYSGQLSELIVTERGVKKDITQKQKEERRINAAIKEIIRREIEAERRRAEAARRAAEAAAERNRKANESTSTTKGKNNTKTSTSKMSESEVLRSTPEAVKLSNDFRSNRGSLPWPVSNAKIMQDFGGESVGRNVNVEHISVKIQTSSGAAVKAVFAGEVSSVLTMYGQRIIMIKHGEYYTVYNNMGSVSVSKGQKVSTGQTIGTADVDSDTGVPMVDFSVYQGSTPLNPMSWLAR